MIFMEEFWCLRTAHGTWKIYISITVILSIKCLLKKKNRYFMSTTFGSEEALVSRLVFKMQLNEPVFRKIQKK